MRTRHKGNSTPFKIIQVTMGMFLEKGVSKTTVAAIANKLNISTGNITFYYPTKEHVLGLLVEMLCAFQWEMMKKESTDGVNPLTAACLETAAMAAICEENEVAKDFYLSSYTQAIPLEIIRKNDARRAKIIYAETCKEWDDGRFAEMQSIVSGIEYGLFMVTDSSAPMERRVEDALRAVMSVYQVPISEQDETLKKVFSMDYRGIGRRILKEFIDYVEKSNANAVAKVVAVKKAQLKAKKTAMRK